MRSNTSSATSHCSLRTQATSAEPQDTTSGGTARSSISSSKHHDRAHCCPASHALTAAVNTLSFGSRPSQQRPSNSWMPFSQRPLPAQAPIAELHMTTLSSHPAFVAIRNACKAKAHHWPRSIALIVAPWQTEFGARPSCGILSSKLNVRDHWSPSPQPFIAALSVTTWSSSCQAFASRTSAKAASHRCDFPQALIAVLYEMMSGVNPRLRISCSKSRLQAAC
mmetsp:Transcript_84218/g.167240  ORF Transcript_84218/g.167240 Transcript_84218/m.167240 type:complete len:223 (-) Transcript_84218:139-807(-)